MPATSLILASSSPYRAALLQRLGLRFGQCSPDIDEKRLNGEAPPVMAVRLARTKALAVSQRAPHALVIGSDQVLATQAGVLGKPGTRERAMEQLEHLSGRTVTFHTAVALVRADPAFEQVRMVDTQVRFRKLDRARIESYLAREPAFDCAGSAKCEGLGISLCHALTSDDPTAIIGLPLISVVDLLAEAGVDIP